MSRMIFALAVLAMLFGVSVGAHAAMINDTLGNDTPGFNDGDTPTVADVGTAQGGQPVPFDQGYGTDGLLGGNFSQNWTHTYTAIADPILSASITFGIYDHDSIASMNQLASFMFGGANLTAFLNPMFEALGEGADSQYDVYTLALPGSTFADLADGSVNGALSLQGPGLVFALFPMPGLMETTTNGANLIFSTLTIETQDPLVMPEPATWGLFVLGLGALLWYRRRLGVGMR